MLHTVQTHKAVPTTLLANHSAGGWKRGILGVLLGVSSGPRHGDLGQSGVREGPVPDRSDTVGNNDRGQAGTVLEGAVLDGGDGRGNGYGDHFRASLVRLSRNGEYSVGYSDVRLAGGSVGNGLY